MTPLTMQVFIEPVIYRRQVTIESASLETDLERSARRRRFRFEPPSRAVAS